MGWKEEIAEIGEEFIYRKYYPNFQLNKKFKSPFTNEKTPSFSFFVKKGIISFKCFSSGIGGNNPVSFVMALRGLSFVEAMNDIKSSFGANWTPPKERINVKEAEIKESLLQVEIKQWSEEGLAYWADYRLTPYDLKLLHIFEIGKAWYNKKKRTLPIGLNFGYYFPVIEKIKVYTPNAEDKKDKWIGSVSSKHIEGLNELDQSKPILILTKSRKDRGVGMKLFPEFNWCNTQNESAKNITPKDREIMDNYNIIVFWDNDETGIREAALTGYKTFHIPQNKANIKDISDSVKAIGAEKTRKRILQLLKEQDLC